MLRWSEAKQAISNRFSDLLLVDRQTFKQMPITHQKMGTPIDEYDGRTTSRTNLGEITNRKMGNFQNQQETVKKGKLVRPLFKTLERNSISKIIEKRQISKQVKERYSKSKNTRYEAPNNPKFTNASCQTTEVATGVPTGVPTEVPNTDRQVRDEILKNRHQEYGKVCVLRDNRCLGIACLNQDGCETVFDGGSDPTDTKHKKDSCVSIDKRRWR